MDEGKLRQQAERGDRAKRILEDELVKEALDSIEQTIIDSWKESKADDERGRYNAYLMHRLLQNFREQFTLAVYNGEAAKKELLKVEDPSIIRRMKRG